jgi:IS30 family transposase
MDIIVEIQDEIGMRTVTFDNGMEFALHYLLHEV